MSSLIRVFTSTLHGVAGLSVEVEVRCREAAKPTFTIVGLGDSAVRESRERIIAALSHIGIPIPSGILVNLAPAEIKKEGSSLDLAIAVGVLAAGGFVPIESLQTTRFFGELSLDGAIRPVKGIAALVAHASEEGANTIITPSSTLPEASLLGGTRVQGVHSLSHLVRLLKGEEGPAEVIKELSFIPFAEKITLDQVHGQDHAKQALVTAAAGGHHLLFKGPPGCGKSMLSSCLPSLLPPPTEQETREIVKIHSVAGLPVQPYLAGSRPYRTPHATVSDAGLIGGGVPLRPGEISLAHRGVLFLDEFPEFRRKIIDTLRVPLEEGKVQVTRAAGSFLFPAQFQLVVAMNLCPCGRRGMKEAECSCTKVAREGYLAKISQPILDRIDLQVELQEVGMRTLLQSPNNNSSSKAIDQINYARKKQYQRQACLNVSLSAARIKEIVSLSLKGRELIEVAATRFSLSARGVIKVLRIARTLADLSDTEEVTPQHLSQALRMRGTHY